MELTSREPRSSQGAAPVSRGTLSPPARAPRIALPTQLQLPEPRPHPAWTGGSGFGSRLPRNAKGAASASSAASGHRACPAWNAKAHRHALPLGRCIHSSKCPRYGLAPGRPGARAEPRTSPGTRVVSPQDPRPRVRTPPVPRGTPQGRAIPLCLNQGSPNRLMTAIAHRHTGHPRSSLCLSPGCDAFSPSRAPPGPHTPRLLHVERSSCTGHARGSEPGRLLPTGGTATCAAPRPRDRSSLTLVGVTAGFAVRHTLLAADPQTTRAKECWAGSTPVRGSRRARIGVPGARLWHVEGSP